MSVPTWMAQFSPGFDNLSCWRWGMIGKLKWQGIQCRGLFWIRMIYPNNRAWRWVISILLSNTCRAVFFVPAIAVRFANCLGDLCNIWCNYNEAGTAFLYLSSPNDHCVFKSRGELVPAWHPWDQPVLKHLWISIRGEKEAVKYSVMFRFLSVSCPMYALPRTEFVGIRVVRAIAPAQNAVTKDS